MSKPEQLSSAIDRAVRDVFSRGFNDPRISGLLTIIAVKVSQDGREAFVDVSVLPGEKGALSIHGLNAAASHIRREVGDRIRVRTMPQLTFRLDESLKKQLKVLSALDKVREEMAAKGELPILNAGLDGDVTNAERKDVSKSQANDQVSAEEDGETRA